jgi:hypothetical protein
MPDCPASSQSGAGMKKTNDARTSLDYAAAVRHFFCSSYKYRTELMYAGMPMPSYISLALKGTVARDFLPLVFSTNRPHIVPEFTP